RQKRHACYKNQNCTSDCLSLQRGKPGLFSQSDNSGGNKKQRRDPVEPISRAPTQRLTVPTNFPAPKARDQIRPENPDTTRRENGMLPPTGEWFSHPTEQTNLRCRS